jgi:hypothetical protein
MPSLYGTGTSYTVTASNVITLYKVSTSSAVITATTYSTNLVGLYGGSYSALPTNAAQLIQLFDNNGNVNFYLDPATNSSTIFANFIGSVVSNVSAGTGISVSTSTGSVVISNTGVLSVTAGTNTNVSSTTGNITIWSTPVATGVTSLAAGTGISVSTSTGSVTVTNVGVTGLIAGTNTNISSTTGNITIWTTGGSTFDISTWTNQRLFTTSSVQFNQISITGTNIATTVSAVSVNLSGVDTITPQNNTSIWAVNKPSTVARFLFDTYIDPDGTGNRQDRSFISGRRARGTPSAPSAVQDGDVLFRVNGFGYNGTSFPTNASAGINFVADENYTTATQAGKISFDVLPSSATTTGGVINIVVIDQNGVDIRNGKILRLTTGSNITFGDGTIQTTAFTGTVAGGVTSLAAGTGISVNTSTGAVTVSNTGVLDLTGTAALGVSASTGSITLTNLGVTSLTAGTNTNISASTGSITIWSNAVPNGVSDLTAGAGIAVSTSTGSVTVSNIGVLDLTGGTAITVSNSTGSVTINNAGVTSLTAGTNTNISSTTGNITIWTDPVVTGVTSLAAGTGISVSTSTGSVTVTNIGVLDLTGTAALGVSANTGSVTLTNLGVTSLTAGTNTNISASTGSVTIWTNTPTPFDISTWTNQRLFTTSSVQFSGMSLSTGTEVDQVVSAGGYPLDGNGQALLEQGSTQSGAMIVSNYTAGIRPTIRIRGYGQNMPGGSATTTPSAGIFIEGGRGTQTTSTALQSGDTLGGLNFGGYDGANWLTNSGTGGPNGFSPGQQFYLATENWANNGSTTTNAGTRLLMRVQPQGVQASATSRQYHYIQTWTAGSTATTAPPQLNIQQGTADSVLPNFTPSGGVGSFGIGFGSTNINYFNTKNTIYGVPSTDPAADNITLSSTNFISIVSNRRSGVTGRRDVVAAGDSLGGLLYYTQSANSATGIGNLVATMIGGALETSSVSARGTSLSMSTVQTGTTTLNTRLFLSDRLNNHNSDEHRFNAASGAAPRLSLSTTLNSNTYNSDTHTFNNTAGSSTVLALATGTNTYNNNIHNFNVAGGATSIVQFNTTTGVALKGYSETQTTAAYTATFAPNVLTATIFAMVLTGNITFNGFTNPQAGQSAVFFFTQDATGSRLLTSSMKYAGGSKTLSTAGTSTDMISVLYAGAAGYYASLVKGFV